MPTLRKGTGMEVSLLYTYWKGANLGKENVEKGKEESGVWERKEGRLEGYRRCRERREGKEKFCHVGVQNKQMTPKMKDDRVAKCLS